jgi:hypothetical protein
MATVKREFLSVAETAQLRMRSSVSLSFRGTALVSPQSCAPSASRTSQRSTETSSPLLPPTAAMWYSRAFESQGSCHQHVHDDHHDDPPNPDAAP